MLLDNSSVLYCKPFSLVSKIYCFYFSIWFSVNFTIRFYFSTGLYRVEVRFGLIKLLSEICVFNPYPVPVVQQKVFQPTLSSRVKGVIPLSCWTRIYPAFGNSVDSDQLASEEANWSGSALFAILYVNFYQQSGSRNLTGCYLEVGVAS